MVDCDSSQIEARTLAWLAGQDDLVAAFDKGEDVYKIMASRIYNRPTKDITDEERFVGKTTILGAGYGMGHVKFQAQLKTFGVVMSASQTQYIITTYRETYPKIVALWSEGGNAITAMLRGQTAPLGKEGVVTVNALGIRLPNGLYLKYPNLRAETGTKGKLEFVYDQRKGRATIPNRLYGGKLIENVCQALARIVIGEQMLMVAKRYRPVMTVHDAIAIVAPQEEIDDAQAYVEQCMQTRPTWAPELPLACEAGNGFSYGEC